LEQIEKEYSSLPLPLNISKEIKFSKVIASYSVSMALTIDGLKKKIFYLN
jgi:hypothetical protein